MQGGKSAKAQPFSEHVRELRQRLIYSFAALLMGSIVGYAIHERILTLITHPLHQKLYYTTPTGGFNAIIKISILFGVIVAVPVFVYQLGKFLSPAFKHHNIRAFRMAFLSVILALLGVLFAYYISLPAALHFLANIDTNNLQSLITINEYLNFASAYVAGFALLFQLPLILLFINRIKPQRPGGLMRYQKWVILVSFILAAVLTPTPDPINQAIMALPIILLYQFSIGLIWIVNRRNKIDVAEPVLATMVAWEDPEAPVLPVSTAAPSAYSAATYSAPTPFPSSVIEPTMTPQAPTAVVAQKPKPQPKLIMDIFWVPQNPAV